jgi:hypothetical protein
MTMRDLFKDDDDYEDEYNNQEQEQPQLTDGGEEGQPSEEGVYDDGMGGVSNVGPTNEIATMPHDFRYVDRFIKVKGIPKDNGDGTRAGYLLNPEFAENFVINFLSSQDQKHIWRRFADVQDEASGEGNEQLTKASSDLLALRVLMKRSSTENDLNLNERTAHIESRSRQSIKTTSNVSRAQNSGGWLGRLFGK